MEVYRITQEKYAADMTGNGARLYGGRWNSEGQYALYTASSRALALLEILAHTPIHILKEKKYKVVTLSIPDNARIEIIHLKKLKADWDAWDLMYYTQKMGDAFLRKSDSLLLQVPSVLVPEEMNYMLNPLHPLIKEVQIAFERDLKFNERLLKAV
jgi:RES domain-containing protein